MRFVLFCGIVYYCLTVCNVAIKLHGSTPALRVTSSCFFRDGKEYWMELCSLVDVPRFDMAQMFLSRDSKRGKNKFTSCMSTKSHLLEWILWMRFLFRLFMLEMSSLNICTNHLLIILKIVGLVLTLMWVFLLELGFQDIIPDYCLPIELSVYRLMIIMFTRGAGMFLVQVRKIARFRLYETNLAFFVQIHLRKETLICE